MPLNAAINNRTISRPVINWLISRESGACTVAKLLSFYVRIWLKNIIKLVIILYTAQAWSIVSTPVLGNKFQF